MTGQPDTPVSSEEDRRERDAWRRERVLSTRRVRRGRLRRIDYANVAPETAAIIDLACLRAPHVGGDVSTILNRIMWSGRLQKRPACRHRGDAEPIDRNSIPEPLLRLLAWPGA
jgi:hypothetical protein